MSNKQPTSAETLLRRVRETLDSVTHAYEDFLIATTRSRQLTAVRSLISEGRNVTFALQKLKHEPGFDDWYPSIQEGLKQNGLFRFFADLRTDIVHEGKLDIQQYVSAELPPFSQLPDGFAGWSIGSDGRLYMVRQPLETSADIALAPLELQRHVKAGEMIDGTPEAYREAPLAELLKLYVDELASIVHAAFAKFER